MQFLRARRERGSRGAAAVEFALLVPIVLLLLFGIISYGYMLSFRQAMSQGASEGARAGAVCHLWWHPHNFGVDQAENLAFLRRLFEVYRECQHDYGMRSMTMAQAADAAFAAQPVLRTFHASSAGQRRAQSAVT